MPRPSDRRLWFALVLAALLIGCSPQDPPGKGDLGARERVDIRRRMESGPLEEIRFRTDSVGRLVVSGFCYFPDGSMLNLIVYDSLGVQLGRTQVPVENALFETNPLASRGGKGWPSGRYRIELSATFAPGVQSERVLRESARGSALTGEGMTTTRQGHPAFSKLFQVDL